MAIGTITLEYETASGYAPMRLAEFTVQGDDNYAAGGSPAFELTLRNAFQTLREPEGSLSNLRLSAVTSQDALALDVRYDRANDRLVVRNLSDGAEVAGDQSGTVYRILATWS